MKIRISRRRASGQILIEACIGLSLLCFTWALLSYHSFMTNNRIRTSMAARHAAWLSVQQKAVSGKQLEQAINDGFFYQPLATVRVAPNKQKQIDLINPPLVLHKRIEVRRATTVTVAFGVSAKDLNSSNLQFPFTLMNTTFPFMTNSTMKELLQVQSVCQWEQVGDPWSTSLSHPKDGVLRPVAIVANALNKALGPWNWAYNAFVRTVLCVKECAKFWKPKGCWDCIIGRKANYTCH